jgi:REP element-mobilizing transposase RayT
MGNPLRMYGENEWWFITSRCFQARMLMTPRIPLVRTVCGGVLAKAAEVHGVKVFAYVFMSNHVHLVVRARGAQVAKFLKYFLGNLSKKLAPLCKGRWWNRFWERRASVAPILDLNALEERVAYVLAHGVKERLVRRATDWEGLHCAEQMLDGKARSFPWFNWTKRWLLGSKSRSRSAAFGGRYDEEWSEPVTLELTPLPGREAEKDEERLARIKGRLDADTETQRRSRKPVAGMSVVKRQSMAPPRATKHGVRPLCHAGDLEGWKAFRDSFRSFCWAFRIASQRWLAGERDVEFPGECFKPHVHHPKVV